MAASAWIDSAISIVADSQAAALTESINIPLAGKAPISVGSTTGLAIWLYSKAVLLQEMLGFMIALAAIVCPRLMDIAHFHVMGMDRYGIALAFMTKSLFYETGRQSIRISGRLALNCLD